MMTHQNQSGELCLIRLEAESLVNQLYFLQEALSGLAQNSDQGPQLYPMAIRGLCQQLGAMEDKAESIITRSCSLLGIARDTVAEE